MPLFRNDRYILFGVWNLLTNYKHSKVPIIYINPWYVLGICIRDGRDTFRPPSRSEIFLVGLTCTVLISRRSIARFSGAKRPKLRWRHLFRKFLRLFRKNCLSKTQQKAKILVFGVYLSGKSFPKVVAESDFQEFVFLKLQ